MTGQSDHLIGGAGKDVIAAGYGDDVVSGGDDNDFLAGGEGNDTVGGDGGNDVVTGSTGDDQLFGGTGNDLLYGDGSLNIGPITPGDIASLNFQMTYQSTGFATSATLTNFTVVNAPMPGNDQLYGGAGRDLLRGGGGNDTYLFSRGSGRDTINESSGSDTIRCSNILPGAVRVSRNQHDLTLAVDDTGDSLVVTGWYDGASARVERHGNTIFRL